MQMDTNYEELQVVTLTGFWVLNATMIPDIPTNGQQSFCPAHWETLHFFVVRNLFIFTADVTQKGEDIKVFNPNSGNTV